MRIQYFNSILILLLVTVILPVYGFSQDFTITKVGEWGTAEYMDVFTRGNYAYCAAEEAGIDIFNIKDPANPKKVGNYDTPGQAYGVHVYGNHAYVADGNKGLLVLDISTPASPVPVGHHGTSYQATDIFVENGHAYLIVWLDDLVVFDISNPSSPRQTGSLEMHEPMNIFVSGGYAFIVDDGNLEIVDVSDPTAPVYAGRYDNVSLVSPVTEQGGHVYLSGDNNTFMVIDISDPSQPKLEGSCVISLTAWYDFVVSGTKVYAMDFDGIEVIDVATPSAPKSLGSYEIDNWGLKGISVSGDYVYGASSGLKVLDASTPSAITPVGDYNQSGWAYGLAKKDGYLYLAHGANGLQVLDVSKPSSTVSKGSYYDAKQAKNVFISGDYAYALFQGKLSILDISDPLSPKLKGEISIGAESVFVKGNYAYAALGADGLAVVDVSDPGNPLVTGTWDTQGDYAYEVYAAGDYAYLSDGNHLKTIDISDPSVPSLTGSYSLLNTKDIFRDVVVSGDYAYTLTFGSGLLVLDVSDPTAPARSSSLRLPRSGYDITIDGNYAYIAAGEAGLQVADISDPLSPKLVGNYNTSWRASSVVVDGGYAYVGLGENGKVLVLEITPAGNSGSPQISLNRSKMQFTAYNGIVTGSQSVLLTNSGGGNLSWLASVDRGWMKCSPTSGVNSAEIFVSVDATDYIPETYTGTLTVWTSLADNSTQTVDITLTVLGAGETGSPFGQFSTPLDGSTVSSSIPVTGWALDDVGIQNVQIFREDGNTLAYIGDAVFVEGARPDVEAAYPGYPNNHKAGWGYMMLTNYLPEGDGVYRIHAIVTDIEGNSTDLGVKTITVNNTGAVEPFGAIDTPEQGGLASGSQYVNFGWALTPQPNTIATDGSTITVWVDGKAVGHPVYNQYREDIAAFFPGYNNSDGAVGYFYLDTTQYDNGIHSIHWTATDDAGNTDGIGSRYIKIINPVPRSQATGDGGRRTDGGRRISVGNIPLDHAAPVHLRKGFDPDAPMQTVHPDENGIITIQIREMERVEVHLNGHAISGGQLPIGCSLDKEQGILSWIPPHGFYGNYDFKLIEERDGGRDVQRLIRVTINAKF